MKPNCAPHGKECSNEIYFEKSLQKDIAEQKHGNVLVISYRWRSSKNSSAKKFMRQMFDRNYHCPELKFFDALAAPEVNLDTESKTLQNNKSAMGNVWTLRPISGMRIHEHIGFYAIDEFNFMIFAVAFLRSYRQIMAERKLDAMHVS